LFCENVCRLLLRIGRNYDRVVCFGVSESCQYVLC
jgi:hypothetical protein